MKNVKVMGVVVGAAIVVFAVISFIRSGWTGPAPVPAAVGFPGSDEGSRGDQSSHLTHHPIIVSPRDPPGGTNPAAPSPAADEAWPESPATGSPAARPDDSFLPNPSFLPIPDRIGQLPAEDRYGEWPRQPNGLGPRVPGPASPPGALRTLDPAFGAPRETSPSLHR